MAQGQVELTLREIHSTFYNNLFVLKTTVALNGQPAEVELSKTGEITLKCRYPELRLPFSEVSSRLREALRKYCVCQVNSVWCEAVPFVQVS